MTRCYTCKLSGFTIIEVLVSLVIMAAGLLGMAMLQGKSLKSNQDAVYYAQANLLAYEIGDRIRANSTYWQTNIPTTTQITAATACTLNSPCTPQQMAAYDVKYLQQSLTSSMPGANPGQNIVRITAVNSSPPNCVYDATRPTTLCITINWTHKDQTTFANSTQSLGVTP